MRCAAAAGWSEPNGQQILGRNEYRDHWDRRKKPYNGTPLPRDSVTPLKPQCVTNHPVAYRRNLFISIEPGQVRIEIKIPDDLKRIVVGTMKLAFPDRMT